VRNFARVDSTVLMESESGTGKEMFAQSIHNAGKRAKGPFVGINCASLSSSILESELFGYIDGAFTGARKGGKTGIFEMANGGTIFLDEIGELSVDVQGKLLRVLQERFVMRLGDTKIIPVDVRVIAATNRNLVEDVQQRRFRQDLFFRLSVLRLSIPPLRERKEDIPLLAEAFLRRFSRQPGREIPAQFLTAFQRHDWPGNIRELQNLMELLSVVNKEDASGVLARHFRDMASLSALSALPVRVSVRDEPTPPVRRTPDKKAVVQALSKTNSKTRAASLLGLHRSTLYRLVKKYKIMLQ
jgi:transcriptional regulator with PAS, ATPase and Fis domain